MPKWMQEIKNRRQILKDLKEQYPKGTRIELVKMDDPQAPPIGTFGTVIGVDDTGSLLVNWDNGSGLNVVWGVDVARKVAQGFMSSDLISRHKKRRGGDYEIQNTKERTLYMLLLRV